MSITPVTPGPIPSSGDPLAFSTLSTPAVSTDKLTSYSNDIANGNEMTIIGFSSKIISTTNSANDTAWQIQQSNATSRQKMYYASIQNTLDLLNLYNLFVKTADTYYNAYQVNKPAVNALQPELLAYNSNVPSDIAAVDDINDAINDFNAATITQAQLQTAINTYNAYATTHNLQATATNSAITTFNNSVNATNASIASANQELIDAGLPPLDTQDLYTDNATPMPTLGAAPASPPVADVVYNPAVIATVTNTMDPQGDQDSVAVASAKMQPYFDLAGGQFTITSDLLQAQSAFNSFVQYNLQGTLPFVPDAFYTQAPKISGNSSGSGAGAGSGVSLASIITSLSNPLMEGIIAQSMFTTNTDLQSKPDSPRVVDQLQNLGLSLLSQVGLQAGSSATRLLAGRLPLIDIRSSPVAAALGLTLASETAQLVSSGIIAAAVKELVANSFTGSQEDLDKLASQLTDGLELFILQTALFQAGQSVGSPQLFGQVLSTTAGAQAVGIVKAQASAADVLSDDTARETLAQDVATRANIKADIIRQSIIAASQGGGFDAQAFINDLQEQGIQSDQAIAAESIMQSSLKSEIIGRGVLQNRVTNEQINGTVLDNVLVKQIVTAQPDITNRELRDQLAAQFVSNGATQVQALDTATKLVLGTPVIQATNEEVYANVQNLASIGISGSGLNGNDASTFASNFAATVIGPAVPGSQTSLRDLIDERLSRLANNQDAAFADKLGENFKNFDSLKWDPNVFVERLKDPANTFLICAQTSLMNSHPQPDNYIKGVDIMI